MKKWLKSKTLWFNVVAILAMVGEYLITAQIISPELHLLAVGIINIGLRFISNTKLIK